MAWLHDPSLVVTVTRLQLKCCPERAILLVWGALGVPWWGGFCSCQSICSACGEQQQEPHFCLSGHFVDGKVEAQGRKRSHRLRLPDSELFSMDYVSPSPEKAQRTKVGTHWAGQFTGVPQPAWGTGAGAVRRAAGCPVGTGTSLIAVQAPCPTGTWQGAVRALPPWGEGRRYHLAMPSAGRSPVVTAV